MCSSRPQLSVDGGFGSLSDARGRLCRPGGALVLAILSAAVLLSADPPPPVPAPQPSAAPDGRVIDVAPEGSLVIEAGGTQVHCRLAGVRWPRAAEARGCAAEFLRRLLLGEEVWLMRVEVEVPRDPDASQSAATPRPHDGNAEGGPVWVYRVPDGLFVNAELLRLGYAKRAAVSDKRFVKLLRWSEGRARRARKGVWAARTADSSGAEGAQRARLERRRSERQSDEAGDDVIVYITRSGRKYHRKGCIYLRKSSVAITLREALERGYTPCSRCKPPVGRKP